MTASTDVLVIGAGPTGLGAAAALTERGVDHLVVESGDTPGGMARSVHDEAGFTWDLGGHVIHSHFDSFDKAIAASGVTMRGVRRRGRVWMNGVMHLTPIQKYLTQLPTDLAPEAPAANLAEYYRNQFGADLAARFLVPHTTKMWAHPLENVDHAWTSLRGGSDRRNVPAIGLAADQPPPVEEFFPYPEGGTGALWTAVHNRICDTSRFRFGTDVVSLDLRARTATLDGGEVVSFRSCVSTAPLTTLLSWIGLTPATTDGPSLAASSVYAIGFGFRGDPPPLLADTTYVASPDPGVPWYRATVLSNYDSANAGPGRWNVLCEVSTSVHRPTELESAVAGCRESIRRLGADLCAIEAVWTELVPMGYPVPTLGRDAILRRLDDQLRAHGIHSRGRFGGWRYESCNQDYSYAQGIEAVANIINGDPENVYWHPERF
ncbi:protoporphyrinogen/coproporphyrinogen oxidase [uncultured Jatrophihabitans sp.]|uniref:protoporphyrinogen/coproporphyrinogen oxidase n=1 Tax=uncultured Jatrophihabitans sp. TaxID=1610747 RepID=UPI0035CC8FB1